MNSNAKIKILVGACILIISTLSLIQYYLVNNTYQLTKEKYDAEVRAELGKITSSPVALAFESAVLNNFKQVASQDVIKGLGKKEILKIASVRNDSVIKAANKYFNDQIKHNPKLKGIRYQSRYDEILLQINGKQLTVLSETEKPFVYFGYSIARSNTLLLSRGNTQSFEDNEVSKSTRGNFNNRFLLQIKGSQHIDVSGWKQEVLKRMAGILLLATGLIIAVAILFYLVFSNMIRQKKIADIQIDFANNITHELKTPLTSVNLILKSLGRKEVQGDTDVLNELLRSLKRQHSKIQVIVDSVLESAMLTDATVRLEKINVTEYLSQYINDLHLASHTLKINIEDSQTLLYSHVGTLEKALNNIIDNAVKYSPAGSEISINAYHNKDAYLIEISDEGPGIAPHHQSRIFDKFYRINEQDQHNVKGLGLGLYITMVAVNQLRGTLSMTAKPTEGSKFIIKLPINES